MGTRTNETGEALKRVLYVFFYPCCAYFSVAVYLLSLSIRLLGYSPDTLSLETVFGVLLFSALLAGFNFILFLKSVPGAMKVLLHFLCAVILVVIFAVVTAGGTFSAGAVFISAAAGVLYLIFVPVVLLIRKTVPRDVVRRVLFPFGFYYLAGVLLNEIFLYSTEVTASAPGFINLSKLLVFAAVMCAAEQIFRMKNSLAVRLLLHFIVTMGAVIGIFVFFMGNLGKSSTSAVPCIVIGVIYLITAAVVLIVRSRIESEKNANEEYKKKF